MAAQTPAQRGAYRFGRSLQSESRDVYCDQTTVLDRGLHLDRQPGQWQEPKSEPSLAAAIEQSVRAQLPLRPEPKSYRDYDTLATDYTASVEFLRSATDQMRQFVNVLIEVNNTYSSTSGEDAKLRKAFWEDYYGAMAKEAMSSLVPSAAILSAEWEGLLVEVAAMQLCARIDELVRQLAHGVADALARLQAVELIGRVDWKVDTACDSFYFEDTVLHEHVGQEVVTKAPVGVSYNRAAETRRVRQEVKTTSKDRHVVRHGLHFKVLGNAEKSSVGDFPLVIPQSIQRLLGAAPTWLRDQIQIVRGSLRTDFVVARDIFVEERELTKTHHHEWNEYFDFCPLVIVGDYVLTGWGIREAQIETARQVYGWLYALAFALAALAAVAIGLARMGNSFWEYLAPLAATLSLGAFVEASRQKANARGQTAGIARILAGGLAWFLVSSGFMGFAAALAGRSWVLGFASVLVSAAGGRLLNVLVQEERQKNQGKSTQTG